MSAISASSQNLDQLLLNGLFSADTGMVASALESGADPNSIETGTTPLHFAIQFGRIDAIALLLEYGADPDIEVEGRTAIELAEQLGASAIATMLRDAPDPSRATTPVATTSVDQTASLAETGAQTVPPASQGGLDVATQRLFQALESEDASALRAAIRAGADVNASFAGTTPLAVAILSENAQAVRDLLAAGAEPSAAGPGGGAISLAAASPDRAVSDSFFRSVPPAVLQAALRDAAEAGELQLVIDLLDRGVAPDAETAANLAVVAILSGDVNLLARLLAQGLDANTVSDGATLLGLAISMQDPVAVDVLIAAGADPNRASDGMQPLAMAAVTSRAVAVQLLDAGADPERITDRSQRAALAALAGDDDDLAEFLGLDQSAAPARTDGSLIRAIYDDDLAAFRNALRTESLEQRTPDGAPYLHHLLSTTKVRDMVRIAIRAKPALMIGPRRTNVVDAMLASQSAELSNLALEEYWRVYTEDNIRRYTWVFENEDGVSAINRWLFSRAENPGLAALPLAEGYEDLLTRRDSAGFMPIEVAVMLGDAEATKVMAESITLPTLQPSLQDRARASGDWAVLAALPYDRRAPRSFRKGASAGAFREKQAMLQREGYYTGSIDGIFGAGSRAALDRFLADVEAELLRMFYATAERDSFGSLIDPNGNWQLSASEVEKSDDSRTIMSITVEMENQSCDWVVTRWKSGGKFVGCVRRTNGVWNANGFAKHRFASGRERLILLGSDGWEGAVELR